MSFGFFQIGTIRPGGFVYEEMEENQRGVQNREVVETRVASVEKFIHHALSSSTRTL